MRQLKLGSPSGIAASAGEASLRSARRIAFAMSIGLPLAMASFAASAEVELVQAGNLKVTLVLTGGVGAFGVNNVDFGRGNFDSNSSRVRTSRTWLEVWAAPSISFEYLLDDVPTDSAKSSRLYGTLSVIGTATLGYGDAVAGTSTTSFHPAYLWPEDAFIGWKSGGLLPDLGDNAIDISIGNQPLSIGDGLVINGAVNNAFQRAAFYTSPRSAFQKTVVLKLDPSELVPLRGTFFHLEDVSNQSLLRGLDQPKSQLLGGSIDWHGDARPDKLGNLADMWVMTGTYFQIYRSDQTPLGNISANRDGLNVFSARAAGSFLPFDRNILFFAEYVAQINDRPGRKTNANGWYVEPGYQFTDVPWSPIVTVRYASFSGDNDPTGGGTKHSYDPLFYGAGGRGLGPGTWYLGEIYGWYQQGLTNITVEQVSLRASPTEQLNIGANYYHIDFNKLGQVNQLSSPGAQVTSKRAMDELDLYAEWSPMDWLTVVPTVAVGIPGPGYKQVNTGTGQSGGSTILLGQVVASVKF
jgi:Alginate export